MKITGPIEALVAMVAVLLQSVVSGDGDHRPH